MCVLGKRLLKDITIDKCNKTFLKSTFCSNETTPIVCDKYYTENNISIVQGIKGLSSGILLSMLFSCFLIEHKANFTHFLCSKLEG